MDTEEENLAESQELVSPGGRSMDTAERKKSLTRIPVDRGNSRILRRSINNYLSQSTQVQEELDQLQNTIEKLKLYINGLESLETLERQQMQDVEYHINNYNMSAKRVRSLLISLEPYNTSTVNRRNNTFATPERNGTTPSSATMRRNQHYTFMLHFYTTNHSYKVQLEKYHTMIEYRNQCKLNNIAAHDDDDDNEGQSLLDENGLNGVGDVSKLKQLLSQQQNSISIVQAAILDWHRQMSASLPNRETSVSKPLPPSWSMSSFRSQPSMDYEKGDNGRITPTSLSSPVFELPEEVFQYKPTTPMYQKDYGNKHEAQKKRRRVDTRRCIPAFICVILLFLVILASVGVCIYFLVYKPATDFAHQSRLSNFSTVPSTSIATQQTGSTTTEIVLPQDSNMAPGETTTAVTTANSSTATAAPAIVPRNHTATSLQDVETSQNTSTVENTEAPPLNSNSETFNITSPATDTSGHEVIQPLNLTTESGADTGMSLLNVTRQPPSTSAENSSANSTVAQPATNSTEQADQLTANVTTTTRTATSGSQDSGTTRHKFTDNTNNVTTSEPLVEVLGTNTLNKTVETATTATNERTSTSATTIQPNQ